MWYALVAKILVDSRKAEKNNTEHEKATFIFQKFFAWAAEWSVSLKAFKNIMFGLDSTTPAHSVVVAIDI